MKVFTSIPFLRLIIPFIAGIFISFQIKTNQNYFLYLVLLLVPLVYFNFFKFNNQKSKKLFLLSADVFLALLGFQLTQLKNVSNKEYYFGNQVNTDSVTRYLGVVNELPVKKGDFTKCELEIRFVKSGKQYRTSEGKVIAYIKSKNSEKFKPGTSLFFSAKLTAVAPPQNPMEFDYRVYLQHKQIFYTVFLDSSDIFYVPDNKELNPVWRLGLACKYFVLSRLKTSGLTDQAYGICAALLTGYDDEIDRNVMDAFSHSGTLHVLSVSGLHTGLIYLFFNFLFDIFDKNRKYRLSRLFFMTLLLWFFALVTGFSAPVLRAVIMFNLLGIGSTYFRGQSRNQINILLISAFLLLCYNPFYLLDVGFQLSYFALFGILYFQPKFYNLWQAPNLAFDYTWKSISASFAATLSTLPLTLFYFKQFPLWFFICNLVVVPATFLLLFLAVIAVFKMQLFAILINYITTFLIWFIEVFNSKYFGYIDSIDFTWYDACFLSALLFFITLSFQYRSYKKLVISLLLVICWQFISLISSVITKNQSLFTVYNIKKTQAVAIKNKKELSLCLSDTFSYNYHIKPHLISLNYPEISRKKFNYLKSRQNTILFLDKPGFWPEVNLSEINTLVISNNFKITLKDLAEFKRLKTIVLDASNNRLAITWALELSRKFGIYFYNTKTQGAYLSELR